MSVLVQREAAKIREQWLGWALSTLPADRPAAEAAISELYDLIGLAPPRFHWVLSPLAALVTEPPGVPARESVARLPGWPLPARFSALIVELCYGLDRRVEGRREPLERLIRQEIRFPVSQSVSSSLLPPLQAAHDVPFYQVSRWYSRQAPSWVAHYDALRRLAGVEFTAEQRRRLGLWETVARSCGWWWPRQDVCVVSERPTFVHTETAADDGRVRLHHADGPAIGYADGWNLHSWHGTQVPAWVIEDPDVRRIANEGNVEVRRCAIERIGWASYIEQAELRLVSVAPDPGNPGFELQLYDMRRETGVLLAVNGSLERDGHRRRYGLTVPGYFDDPIAAAGWTYGLSGEQYSLLLRRT
ncbi:DUF6745 domain-containing protein [Nonomuraea basaltis]|uniref:DUF6745 domain-containing protein n=1 Tax=Nonomuraea basaltis TaxID=2495887 RepID=UPI00197FF1C2|nr:hypothetical protein [Nonomuraea basaltis]